MIGFGPVPLKREGAIANPDEYTWECNLNACASSACAAARRWQRC